MTTCQVVPLMNPTAAMAKRPPGRAQPWHRVALVPGFPHRAPDGRRRGNQRLFVLRGLCLMTPTTVCRSRRRRCREPWAGVRQGDPVLRVGLGADRVVLRPARQVGEEDADVPVAVHQTGADVSATPDTSPCSFAARRAVRVRLPADAPGGAAARFLPEAGARSRTVSEGRPQVGARTGRRFLPFVSASGCLITLVLPLGRHR